MGVLNGRKGTSSGKSSPRVSGSELEQMLDDDGLPMLSPLSSRRKRSLFAAQTYVFLLWFFSRSFFLFVDIGVSFSARLATLHDLTPWTPSSIQEIMDDHWLLSVFDDFLVDSHCEEHLTALMACLDFKSMSDDPTNARPVALAIMRHHFLDNADQPVNMNAQCRTELLQQYNALKGDARGNDGIHIPADFFDAIILEITKLLTHDSFSRFVVSKDIAKKYLAMLEFSRRIFKKSPDEEASYKMLTLSQGWNSAKALMPDIQLVEKKQNARGTILVRDCSLERITKMLLKSTHYVDWIPDFDEMESEASFEYCSAFGVTKFKTAKLNGIMLAVMRLSSNFFGTTIAWQTCLQSESDVHGCFFLDHDVVHNATKVSFVVTLGRTKMRPAELVQSVLLGMLLAIGGQCEGRDPSETMLQDFQFLRRI